LRVAATLAWVAFCAPEGNAAEEGGDDNLANLKRLKGAEFNRAYIDHEVTTRP